MAPRHDFYSVYLIFYNLAYYENGLTIKQSSTRSVTLSNNGEYFVNNYMQ